MKIGEKLEFIGHENGDIELMVEDTWFTIPGSNRFYTIQHLSDGLRKWSEYLNCYNFKHFLSTGRNLKNVPSGDCLKVEDVEVLINEMMNFLKTIMKYKIGYRFVECGIIRTVVRYDFMDYDEEYYVTVTQSDSLNIEDWNVHDYFFHEDFWTDNIEFVEEEKIDKFPSLEQWFQENIIFKEGDIVREIETKILYKVGELIKFSTNTDEWYYIVVNAKSEPNKVWFNDLNNMKQYVKLT